MKFSKTIVAVLALALSGVAFADVTNTATSQSHSAAGSASVGINHGAGNNNGNVKYSPTYKTVNNGSDELKTVPDVGAPGLTTTMTETCMGSTSAGVAWLGFGVTGGTTWRDGRCANRLDARQWGNFGVQVNDARLVYVGVELLCEDEGNQRAAARVGVICGPQGEDAPAVDEKPVTPIRQGQASVGSELPEFFVDNDS